jgi:hypothetical protein
MFRNSFYSSNSAVVFVGILVDELLKRSRTVEETFEGFNSTPFLSLRSTVLEYGSERRRKMFEVL